jgi:hypothetical protein
VPVVVPRRNVQVSMRVEMQGNDEVTIGGRALTARHIILAGEGTARHIWADDQGRVLQIRIGDITAIRDEAP